MCLAANNDTITETYGKSRRKKHLTETDVLAEVCHTTMPHCCDFHHISSISFPAASTIYPTPMDGGSNMTAVSLFVRKDSPRLLEGRLVERAAFPSP